MTPKQINQMKYTATVFAGIIICAGIVWLAFQFEAHKSAHKLPNKAVINIINKPIKFNK